MEAAMTFETSVAVAAHLNAAIDEGGTDPMLCALGDVIKAKGEEHIATLTGCTLKELRAAGKPGSKPAFSVVHGIVRGLGLRIILTPFGDSACR
jgi:probable addiction module antidote protein